MTETSKRQIRLVVNGMICDDCERRVFHALESVGSRNIFASFRKNEATFDLDDLNRLDDAKQAITDAGYKDVSKLSCCAG